MSTQKHEPDETPVRRPPGRTSGEPGDGRNERQRAKHDEEQQRERLPKAEGDEQRELLEKKPFDFIERTKPEDRVPDQTVVIAGTRIQAVGPAALLS